MRLLLITNDFLPKPGGIQQYLGNVVAAYPDPIHVIAPADRRAESGAPQVTRGKSRFMWPTSAVTRSIVAEARRFDPDVVLFGAPHPLAAMGPRLRHELAVPFGVLSHGAEVTLPAATPGVRQWLGRTLRAADVLFAVSRFTQRRVERLTQRDVTYVGAGVDVQRFAPGPPPAAGVPVVGCVSRFVPRKGQHRLIRAAARLDVPVELLLVGKGRGERRLRRLAGRAGVRTRFLVDVPWAQLPGLYRQMDVFCMPCKSRWMGLEVEGFGLVFLEAAATGLPVLAGDSGGSPETVDPARTGYVVHSVTDIVEGLQLLLSDPEGARDLGAAGRRRVEEEFTWNGVVDRMREAFATLL